MEQVKSTGQAEMCSGVGLPVKPVMTPPGIVTSCSADWILSPPAMLMFSNTVEYPF